MEPFKPCATDPTYRYFEEVQYDAYTADPGFLKLLQQMRDIEAILKTLKDVGKQLDGRPNQPSSPSIDSKRTAAFVQQEMARLKLPTCYESRLIYWMLANYVQRIEAARTALRMPSVGTLRFGSLPTTEINAYTYPASKSLGSVIAFNTQLFMFAYQMTKVTLPTIGIEEDPKSNRVEIDISLARAMKALTSNPDTKINFSMALLEFLLLTSPSTQPLAPAYDPLVITFTEGMETFAVAHEYGHVIKKHKSGAMNIRLGADSEKDAGPAKFVPVLERSWKQELEADAVGIQLLGRSLQDDVNGEADKDLRAAKELRWVYVFKGALFFFKCLDIVERAKYVRDVGQLPPTPTLEEREYIRGLAEGTATSEQRSRFSYLKLKTHPPAWYRLERANVEVETYLRSAKPSPSALDFSRIGDGLLKNVDVIWQEMAPRFPVIVRAVGTRKTGATTSNDPLADPQMAELAREAESAKPIRKALAPVGCLVEVAAWTDTFLCSSALQRAVVRYIENPMSDADILASYSMAISKDWRLLSGLQVRWAEGRIAESDDQDRSILLAVLGLAGDLQTRSFLEGIDTRGWSDGARRLYVATLAYLERNGRDTSVVRLREIMPQHLQLEDLLCFPKGMERVVDFRRLIPAQLPDADHEFLIRARAVVVGRSLASMALYGLAEHKEASLYSFWTDLLFKNKEYDVALTYARAGIERGGPRTSLENDIGNILSAKGQIEEANKHYMESLSAGRNDGWPELNIAKNFADQDSLEEAERWFRSALTRRSTARSQSEYAGYLNEFAWFVATKRSGDRAKITEALEASTLANRLTAWLEPNYLDTLAECYRVLGDRPSAVRAATEALKLVRGTDEELRYAERLQTLEKMQ